MIAWLAPFLASIAVGAPMTSAEPPVDIVDYFQDGAVASATATLSRDPDWYSDTLGKGGALSFGDPVPLLSLKAGDYHLVNGRMLSSLDLSAYVSSNDSEYCALAQVDGRPAPLIACTARTSQGLPYVVSVTEVQLADGASKLPSEGIAQASGGWVGVEGSSVIAVDASAAAWLEAASVDQSTFVEGFAKQAAEWTAVSRIDGPVFGGVLPLFGGGDAAIREAWEAQVLQGLAIPDSEAWLADADAGAVSGDPVVESPGGTGVSTWSVTPLLWGGGILAVVVLGWIAWVAVGRARHV